MLLHILPLYFPYPVPYPRLPPLFPLPFTIQSCQRPSFLCIQSVIVTFWNTNCFESKRTFFESVPAIFQPVVVFYLCRMKAFLSLKILFPRTLTKQLELIRKCIFIPFLASNAGSDLFLSKDDKPNTKTIITGVDGGFPTNQYEYDR